MSGILFFGNSSRLIGILSDLYPLFFSSCHNWFKIHKCTCLDNTKEKKEDEHEIWKLEDLDERIHQLTTKTVIEPNGRREMRIFKQEMIKWMTTLNHITDKKSLKIKKVKYLQSEIEDMIHMIQKKWDGWVFLDRDKNIGSFAIACPMWYRHQLIKTFD